MKTFFTWFVAASTLFGALAGGYHAYLQSNPREVLVVVDSSYPMAPEWSSVPATLDRLDDRRYSRYSLWTEKAKMHGWMPELRLGRSAAFAPRNFSRLLERAKSDPAGDAARRILVTNALDSELNGFNEWEIVRPGK